MTLRKYILAFVLALISCVCTEYIKSAVASNTTKKVEAEVNSLRLTFCSDPLSSIDDELNWVSIDVKKMDEFLK